MSTLLRPEEVEKIRDWAATEYKAAHRLQGHVWDGKIPVAHLIRQLRIVITQREAKKETAKVSKLSKEEIDRRIDSLEAELQGAEVDENGVNLDNVLRYYSTDPKSRFDIQFVRDRQLAAEDALGLWVYIPFIVLFSFFLVDSRRLGSGYWMNAGVLDKFLDEEFTQSDDLRFKKTFYDVMTAEEYWEFFEGPLMESIWQDGPASKGNGFVQDSNMPVGAMKVRQIRVAGEGCGRKWDNLERHHAVEQMRPEKIISRVNDFNEQCYPEYVFLGVERFGSTDKASSSFTSLDVVHDGTQFLSERERCQLDPTSCDEHSFPISYSEVTPIDLTTVPESEQIAADAYRHRSCGELNTTRSAVYHGKAGYYQCDGFALVVPFNWEMAKVTRAVQVLKNGITVTHFNRFTQANETIQVPWIDKQTRGLSIEMFLYNQNLDLFTKYTFFVEITAGGAFIPLHNTIGFNLFDFDSHSWVYFFFFFLYFAWTMAYVLVWFHQLWERTEAARRQMLQSHSDTTLLWAFAWLEAASDFWVWFDCVNLTLFMAAWTMRFYLMHVSLSSNSLLQNVYYPPDYERIATLDKIAVSIDAMNAMLVYLRIFYFLKLNPYLNVLTRTVNIAKTEILGILVIFLLVFWAFATMCYIVYGHMDENYRTLPQSAISLTLMLLGDFDYVALRESHRIFTPIFFGLFQVLAVFLLFNLVIAVLGEAFEQVHREQYADGALVDNLIAQQYQRWKPGGTIAESKWKVPPPFLRNALVTEILYWCKHIVLRVRHHICGLSRRAFEEEMAYVKAQNPRLYWRRLEKSYYQSKTSTNFTDHLQLTPKVLDNYLEDTLGKDKGYFLYDNETGEEGLVLLSAKRTKMEPQTLVEEMMSYHHYWYREMSQKTFTGSPEDFEEMRRTRSNEVTQRMRDALDSFFNVKFAVGPQRRWEEQKAEIDQLKTHLIKITPDTGHTHQHNKRRTDAAEALERKIHDQVEQRLDTLLCSKINEILEKIMSSDMTQWIAQLVDEDEQDGWTAPINAPPPAHKQRAPALPPTSGPGSRGTSPPSSLPMKPALRSPEQSALKTPRLARDASDRRVTLSFDGARARSPTDASLVSSGSLSPIEMRGGGGGGVGVPPQAPPSKGAMPTLNFGTALGSGGAGILSPRGGGGGGGASGVAGDAASESSTTTSSS